MLQSLNVKNPKAYQLATELARLQGKTLTAVVIAALEQQLAQERRKASQENKAERMLAFADWFSKGMAPGSHSSRHAELYGEDGMPV